MYKVTLKTFLLAISFASGLGVYGIATASGRGAGTPSAPMIMKTAVDTKESLLIITGRNFGPTMPTVFLADQALDVQRFTPNEIVALLPRELAPATYGVVVTSNDRNRASSNFFTATLFGTKKK